MTSSIIHGHLEITVVECNISSEPNLVSRSHTLYVCFQYGGNTYHITTIPSQDGGMNTTYPNKCDFPIDGQSDLKFVVWKNINPGFHYHDFMGSGWVQLHNVVSNGSEESSCPFKKGNIGAGELKLVLKYTHAHQKNYDPSSLAKSLQQSYPQGPSSSNYFSTDPTLSSWPHPFLQHSPLYPPPPSYYPMPPYYYPLTYPSLTPHHQYLPPYPPPPQPPPHHYPPQYPVPLPNPSLMGPLSLIASALSIGSSLFQFFGA